MNTNEAIKDSLLFIPDISGVTKFLNETEIIHATHIVAELLEIIIRKNKLGLKIAEIEGDAVFFYRNGKKPTIKEIHEQCTEMFIAFHQHIKLYERDRICNCGSCSHTPNLTLKFIVHYGTIIERKIMGFLQLMGPEVTLAHKLMKNQVEMHEYLLVTESLINPEEIKQLSFNSGHSFYDDIGSVKYAYAYLTALLEKLPPLPERPQITSNEPAIVIEKTIRTELGKAHDLLKDLNRKKEWVVGLKDVNVDDSKVIRIGTPHECLLPLNRLNIVTSENEVKENEITYAEKVINGGFLPKSDQVFKLEKISENEIKVTLFIYMNENFIYKLFFKNILKNSFAQSLSKFKKLLEI